MKPITSTLRRFICAVGLSVLVFGPAANPAFAAPGPLAQIPLYIDGASVEPNVVIVNDDSRSMYSSILSPEKNGYLYIVDDNDTPHYINTHSFTNYVSASGVFTVEIVPTPAALKRCYEDTQTAKERGVWRAWNHDYNKLYYNPAITYKPWPGLNKDGAAYINSNPAQALINPYDPSLGTINLNPDLPPSYITKLPRKLSTTVAGCPA
ncbi:MAG: hypothetical protein LBV36_02620, partial [Chromatiales bacterium]|nr:hypothetical protein [Chromatiales bacterium]